MRRKIQRALDTIEAQENVRIIFACESGSRAWGFPSTDSDYDVRFIYIHPVDWYLSVHERRDVIERPIDELLDINGWDIRKALLLLGKSNPSIIEWLASPIVYREIAAASKKLRDLRMAVFSPEIGMRHYLSMAKGNYQQHLRGENVRAKRYFYVLRPVLACMWMEQKRTPPPLDFVELLDTLMPPGALRSEIDRLLDRKKAGEELAEEPRVTAIHNFLDEQMAHFECRRSEADTFSKPTPELLDKVFRKTLEEIWG